MTAHLICVMSFFVLGGDPVYAGNPPVAAEGAAAAPYFVGPPQAMFAPPPPTPPPPAPPPVAPGAISAPQAPPVQAAAYGAAPPANEYGPGSAVPAAPPAGVQYFSLDELEAEMKKLAWTKGDFTITPYGILWANWVEETGRTDPGNYPLYVQRPREDANGDCFVDARSTRLGFDILGPQIPLFGGAQTGGKIEFDFQRQIDVENKSTVLLRHAYIEVKDDDARLLAGQTWDVISPLYPGVLFYSVGWDAGNIGYRRPQFRAERRFECSDTFAPIAQGSLNTCAPTDVSGTPETYEALSSDWPILEGRLATQLGPARTGMSSLGVRRLQPRGRVDLRLPREHAHQSQPVRLHGDRRAPPHVVAERRHARADHALLRRSGGIVHGREPRPLLRRRGPERGHRLVHRPRRGVPPGVRRRHPFARRLGRRSGTTGRRGCTATSATRSTILSIRT